MPRIRVNGIDMYYEIHGQGEPLVLIAGLAGDHTNWLELVEQLQGRFRCLVFDNRGMGQSDRPEMEYTTQLYANDTAQLMQATGFHAAHIVGLSMGACIAQELCLAFPDTVLSLVLVSGWARPDNYFRELIRLWIWLAENAGPETPWLFGNLWSFSHRMYNENPHKLQALMDGIRDAGLSVPAFVRQARSLVTHDAFARLSGVRAPCLVLVGSHDILTPPVLSEELNQAIPGSQLRILPGLAHAFPLEVPEVLTREILGFLPVSGPGQG